MLLRLHFWMHTGNQLRTRSGVIRVGLLLEFGKNFFEEDTENIE